MDFRTNAVEATLGKLGESSLSGATIEVELADWSEKAEGEWGRNCEGPPKRGVGCLIGR